MKRLLIMTVAAAFLATIAPSSILTATATEWRDRPKHHHRQSRPDRQNNKVVTNVGNNVDIDTNQSTNVDIGDVTSDSGASADNNVNFDGDDNSVRSIALVAPGLMAASDGHCTETISGSGGAGTPSFAVTLGFGYAYLDPDCNERTWQRHDVAIAAETDDLCVKRITAVCVNNSTRLAFMRRHGLSSNPCTSTQFPVELICPRQSVAFYQEKTRKMEDYINCSLRKGDPECQEVLGLAPRSGAAAARQKPRPLVRECGRTGNFALDSLSC